VPLIAMRAASATDTGNVRTSNQDYALVRDEIVAVADGMGGHAGGEIAAQTAIEALDQTFDPTTGVAGLVAATKAANHAVFAYAAREPDLRGMGTTLTAAALVTERGRPVLGLVNVGDSRAYLLADGSLQRLTEDHSVVEEMVRNGELTEEEAAVHPHRHIVTRAIGIDDEIEVDSWDLGDLEHGRLLLCSDGLTNECSDAEIGEILSSLDDIDAAAATLVERALAHGGADNVTVVVVDLAASATSGASAPSAGVTVPVDLPADLPAGNGGAPADEHAPDTVGGPPIERSLDLAPTTPLGAPSDARIAIHRPRETRRERRQHQERVAGARGAAERSRPIWAHERMVSVRVVLFVIVLLAIVGGAAGFITWFNNATYYVGVSGNNVAVYEGRPGGFLWFHPALVYQSSLSTSSVLASNLPLLQSGLLESSYSSARQAVDQLTAEQTLLGLPGPTTTTTTTVPVTTTTTTTVASHTTTTIHKSSGTP
jgi:PPM family protein phosphatase